MADVSRKLRERVMKRDGHCCVECGGMSMLTIQHRANRGMGGNPNGDRNKLSNLITMCWFSNELLEQDTVRRDEGLKYGWKLNSWDNPVTEPVFYRWAREWRYLDDDGSTRLVSDEVIVDA